MTALRPYQRDLIARAQGAFGQGAPLTQQPQEFARRTRRGAVALVEDHAVGGRVVRGQQLSLLGSTP